MDDLGEFDGDASDGDTHEGMPIKGFRGTEPVPDLRRIPRAQWRDVLSPLSPLTRRLSMGSAGSLAAVRDAMCLVGELILSDGVPSQQRPLGMPPRMPAADPPPRGATRRQVSFRLGPDEYARLEEVAELFALRPAALARMLTVRGVERTLYEERRDR